MTEAVRSNQIAALELLRAWRAKPCEALLVLLMAQAAVLRELTQVSRRPSAILQVDSDGRRVSFWCGS